MTLASTLAKVNTHILTVIYLFPPQLQNPVSEAAEQRAGQAEEPELVHGVRTLPEEKEPGWMD